MAIKYHLIQRGKPGDPAAPKKFYASVTSRNNITQRELSEEIADISTVDSIDVVAVIESLLKLIPKHVSNGAIVHLGDFGSFSANIHSKGAETEQDFNKELIKGLRIRFRPGTLVKNVLNDAVYRKAK